jgi:hypothetical protein
MVKDLKPRRVQLLAAWHEFRFPKFGPFDSPHGTRLEIAESRENNMTTCKSFWVGVLAVTLVMAFGSRALALEITIDRPSGSYTSSAGLANGVGGGEFRITGQQSLTNSSNSRAIFTTWSSEIGFITGFETFCLEVSEHVTIPGTYNASIGAAAISAGPGPVGGTDLISIGMARLYNQFADPNLGLQRKDAEGAAYRVAVLNLGGSLGVDNDDDDNDDDGLKVPDGGTTLLLVGIGLTGVWVVQRRLRPRSSPTRQDRS